MKNLWCVNVCWVLGLLCCSGLTACGYVFQGGGSVLPPDVKRIQIPQAVNNTSEPGLSEIVTEALRDRFERYGVLYVVDKIDDADAVLKVRVLRVKRDTRSVTSETDTALQLETVMTLAAELRRVTGPVLWNGDNVTVKKSFGSTSDVVVTSSAAFAEGGLNADDLNALSSREVARGQEAQVFEDLSEQAALKIYTEAVMPDF